MNRVAKAMLAALVICTGMTLGACDDGLIHGKDGLDKLSEELLTGAELVGTVSGSYKSVAWYADTYDGGEDIVHAAVLAIKGKDTWEKESVDTGLVRLGANMYMINADHGYSFYINDPNCTEIMISSGSGSVSVPVTEYPFIAYRKNEFTAETYQSGENVSIGSMNVSFYCMDKDRNVISDVK